jgi:hypothetical protein
MQERQNASFRILLEKMGDRSSRGENGAATERAKTPEEFARELEEENQLSFDTLVEEFLQTENSIV